jgi:acyl-CoA synthetase (NDP forming)
MQILEKQQNLEERQAAAVAEALQARIDEKKAMQQAEYDAQLEQTQAYADMTTQIMGAAWDSAFGNARQGFSDMLKDMAADLAKSAVLGFLRKSIFGASTGGLGFFF